MYSVVKGSGGDGGAEVAGGYALLGERGAQRLEWQGVALTIGAGEQHWLDR
jgi:hypothetical protein